MTYRDQGCEIYRDGDDVILSIPTWPEEGLRLRLTVEQAESLAKRLAVQTAEIDADICRRLKAARYRSNPLLEQYDRDQAAAQQENQPVPPKPKKK